MIFETINNIRKQFQQQSNKKDQEEYPGDQLHWVWFPHQFLSALILLTPVLKLPLPSKTQFCVAPLIPHIPSLLIKWLKEVYLVSLAFKMKGYFLKYSRLVDREGSSFIPYTRQEYPWPRSPSEHKHQSTARWEVLKWEETGWHHLQGHSLVQVTVCCSCKMSKITKTESEEGKREQCLLHLSPSFRGKEWMRIHPQSWLNALRGRAD